LFHDSESVGFIPCAIRQCGIFWNNHRNAIFVNYCRSHSTNKVLFRYYFL